MAVGSAGLVLMCVTKTGVGRALCWRWDPGEDGSILLSVHWALLAQQCGCSSHALSPSPGVSSLLSRAEEPHTAPEVRAHHPFRDLCVHSSDWLSHRDLSGDFAAAVGAGAAPALHTC